MSLLSRNYLSQRTSSLLAVLPSTLEHMKSSHERGMALLWETEGDVTPQQVLDSIGTDAAELFTKANELVQFILEQDPDWEPTPTPFEYTVNPDGTITVGDPVPLEEPATEE